MTNETKKVLYFEGAGCEGTQKNDVENCRIRTAFTNNDGKKIYLELGSGCRYTENKKGELEKTSDTALHVDFCHYITGDLDDCNINRLDIERDGKISKIFDYCKKDILTLVNKYCNCSFTDVVILPEFENYRVHAGKGNYNFMENHQLNPERTAKREAAYKDMYQKGKKLRKYPCVCVQEIAEDKIVFRFPDTDEALKNAGLQREYTYITK